ncbi:MAG TPA: bifunctional 3,4-dihydroxy-2-butanone-4-phosphate synthase/GTP cyclohydrolase II [Porphyromonadaceae bacterium]|uniref:bifunctional 3,4-dihydroxy-2-butanone-4-phosphate synthase/GTP cyclohydrolase II n=1 Tax=Limibacterium fermenti TaxID=3229863 RepID=UPI000E9B88F2|nr:bifunctional 3,4-dihydroxy-2-butanone-4-phosphate synthase/GTP cyclohydrolase II [Porphyromonadaceae bacterium]HBL33118.1 bifunctional 3,4-dihydroxy-2-butanone-4-phosphate synthase/GTP cyclohydrolase II [Porphyromonadaceae bacterium]HBX21277.1 bifunctional 3,4-dihydroxy-2-butanone-4-phosphate synthase/GTP cyclohydrolase II [Porphyromonadaceae bacterium]HBX44503.1 bifunctional 3,4-dihydroxy-2-butanone-4-phosphate synthase/GTP cyclohydrolase II [Porphyromonadaceae bacterium]
MQQEIKLDSIEDAIEEIRKGNFIIVVDDEDRENEGDLIIAAEHITPEKVNFLETHARGLICAPITQERAEELDLPMMVTNNTSVHATPFTVSVDLLTHGCTTGISAYDRAQTILALTRHDTAPEDFGRPGHVFPLRAMNKGVLRRAGHTEATVDFARLAGLYPAGALAEIKKEDGSMARLPELMEMAEAFHLKIVSVAELIKYRLQRESLIERGEMVHLPTEYGNFIMIPFLQKSNGLEHVALMKGEWKEEEPILVRVHSSCVTGDIFGSLRCECGEQLHKALQLIEKEGKGVLVYLNQEGRGIGLMAKAAAYKLQENGLDTVDANLHLGYRADERDYGVGAQILRSLGVTNMRLMTNNPKKRIGLESYGLRVVENVPLEIKPNQYNKFYMETKKNRMGHILHNLK